MATANSFETPVAAAADTALSRLLSLFPDAQPARIPVRIQMPSRTKGARESTMVIYKTRDTAIFSLQSTVFGGESVLLQHPADPKVTPAVAIALIPNGPGWAVAARFLEGTPRWILSS